MFMGVFYYSKVEQMTVIILGVTVAISGILLARKLLKKVL